MAARCGGGRGVAELDKPLGRRLCARSMAGSTFHLTADLTGGLLNTRVGGLVAKVLESDVRKSVENLAALR